MRTLSLKRLRLGRKGSAELDFWAERQSEEGTLGNSAFRGLFTAHFGLDESFYAGKRLLDIGCGPRGSLEWADMASERVGLDPLADEYLKLGASRHSMSYVKGGSEDIPFGDEHFDVISTLNSLDHVDDLTRSVEEITRVARPGASLLLITEVNHEPTPTEPQTFSWDVVDGFELWDVVWDKRNQKLDDIYGSLQADRPYRDGPGLLSARLTKRAT